MIFKKISLNLIRFYQITFSPYLGIRCRFYPSCSQYSMLAIGKHGLLKGIFWGMKRLLKCHPWKKGGFDFP